MAASTLATEERLNRITAAWEEQAPTAKFADMTLAEFKEATKASTDHRKTVKECEDGTTVARVSRNNADEVSNDLADQVVNSVKGNPKFGENSPLYRAFGYVLKSERSSGLTRKSADSTMPTVKAA
jgi:hypothetical protein